MISTSLDESRPRLGLFDFFFVAIILIAGIAFGTKYAVGPTAWDDTLYLHTAMVMIPDPNILNRYFHIYILRLGILLEGGNPFAGSYVAGAFVFSLMTALIYINARLISRSKQPWQGFLALLFFLAEPYVLDSFGAPLADYTQAMMICLGITAYLVTIRDVRPGIWLFPLNGFIFFLALKSKETSIVLAILLAALIVVNNWPFNWKTGLIRFASMVAGLTAGILLFIILDGILLKDAWFGLRWSDFQELINYNSLVNISRQTGSYFSAFTQIGLFASFSLGVLSVINQRKRFATGEWAIWLLVPGMIILLTLIQVMGSQGLIDRYIIPILPVLAILASQCLPTKTFFSGIKSELTKFAVILGVLMLGAITAYLISQAAYNLIGKVAGWSQTDFITSIFEPLVFCLLLAAVMFLPMNRFGAFFFTIYLVLLLTIPSIQFYRHELFSGQFRQANLDRFVPMTIFKKQVSCTTGKVFVSQHYHDDLHQLSRDQQSSLWMFDLSFGCNSQINQFDISPSPQQILVDNYQYVFLPKVDFDALSNHPDQAATLKQKYSISSDPKQLYYLLIHK